MVSGNSKEADLYVTGTAPLPAVWTMRACWPAMEMFARRSPGMMFRSTFTCMVVLPVPAYLSRVTQVLGLVALQDVPSGTLSVSVVWPPDESKDVCPTARGASSDDESEPLPQPAKMETTRARRKSAVKERMVSPERWLKGGCKKKSMPNRRELERQRLHKGGHRCFGLEKAAENGGNGALFIWQWAMGSLHKTEAVQR